MPTKRKRTKPYGKEVILDLYDCNTKKFTRELIEIYLIELCAIIDMEREDLYFWDLKNIPKKELKKLPDHLVGISAVQFIRTSNIVIHTLDRMKKVFLNIFSCKDFDAKAAKNFSKKYFEGKIKKSTVLNRI